MGKARGRPELGTWRDDANRRGAVRVVPALNTVRAWIQPLPPAQADDVETASGACPLLAVRVLDISCTGTRVRTDRGAEAPFDEVDAIELTLDLPTSSAPVVLQAEVRSRRVLRRHVDFGLRFERGRSPELIRSAEEVTSYVMHRQRENLALRPPRD